MNKIVSVTTSSLPIFANKKLQIYSDRVRLEFEKFWRNSGRRGIQRIKLRKREEEQEMKN
jgi:hypothetical protein